MNAVRSLVLRADHAATLRAAAERAFPNECCGLLVGEGEATLTVHEVVPVENVADAPARRFEIDPQRQFDLLRRLRGTSHRVIGHYHSHPNGAAELSAHDLAMAHDPSAVWLLIPVREGRAGDPRAFICPGTDRAVSMPITSPAA
jgi:proteasome lid subunit RPN8/RPN11